MNKKFIIEQLEARLMLSADFQPVPFDGGLPYDDGTSDLSVLETPLFPNTSESHNVENANLQRHELVFIDSRVPEYQKLVDDIMAKQDNGSHLEVIILDSSRDGIEQISGTLNKYANIDAVHLFSHGSDGAVQLGNTWLNLDTLDAYADSIEGWKNSLTGSADLLFYGCDIAAGEDGHALAESLSILTGADIAASDDLTGIKELGGDWDLEFRAGLIETTSAVSADFQENWTGLLTEVTISDDLSSGTYSGGSGWAGNWQEVGEADGAGAGNIQVVSNTLQITTADRDEALRGISRAADLSSAASAYLSFDYDTQKLDDNGQVQLQIKADGSSTWDTLATYKITATTTGNSELIDITSYISVNTEIRLVSEGKDIGGLSDGIDNFIADNINIEYTTTNWTNPLWLTTDNHVSSGGQPGSDTWNKADVIQIADPYLSFEPGTTNGTFSIAFNIDTFAPGKNINGLHYVSTDIQIGSSNFQLYTGDVLLASSDASTLGGLSLDKGDVVVFRPDTPGDYSAGTFSMLLNNLTGDNKEIRGISLIEQNTDVGDVTLQAGDFLFIHGGDDKSVCLFETDDVGTGSTSGTASVLLDGGDTGININKKLVGVDLVETTTTIGGQTLDTGAILLAVDGDGNVGNNGLAVTEYDIFAFDVNKVSSTVLPNVGVASATLFFEGGDVAFDSGAEKLDGLTLTASNSPINTITGASFDSTTRTITLTGTNFTTIADASTNIKSYMDWSKFVWDINGDNGVTTNITFVDTNFVSVIVTNDTTLTLNLTAAKSNAIVATTGYGSPGGADTLDITAGFSKNASGAAASTDGLSDGPIQTITTPTDIAISASSVNENTNTTGGYSVGTLTTTDGDVGDTATYSIVGGADAANFTIGGAGSDELILDDGILDFETQSQYKVKVRITDSGGLTYDEILTITVIDVDEFDVGAVTDSDATANSVAENAGIGSAVGITASASDADATNNTITYSLNDDAGGLFAINSSTGVVTVNGLLDYETASSHDITVRATSSDTSFNTQTFTINVTDVSESSIGPISDNDAAANSVTEDVSAGTAVGITALATDPGDTITYSLDDDAGGLFDIDANTGIVTVNGALDAETAPSHNITVRATSSDTSFNTQVFTIDVTDVDEFDVGAVTDSNATANSVAENAGIGTAVEITAIASDADETNNTITYSLDDNAGGLFDIDANTGVVTVNGTLDYETSTSHNITVRATSQDTSFNTQVFTIDVTDVDEFAVGSVTDSNAAANSVAENAGIGTAVEITASASDADASNNTITYSLDDDAGGLFDIDANTGVVTVNGALDAETATSHNITIRATSSDTSFNTQVFTIDVTDIDEFDVSAVTDSNAAANSVAENAGIGTAVEVTANASDADATNSAITYSLDDDAGGLFAIDANTGVITVNGAMDYETVTSHNITVRATSLDTSFNTQVFTINVTDADEFDVSAVTDSNAVANTVTEDASIGTAAGITTSASDSDATNNAITYSLDDDAGGLFIIDANTGIVTVNGALDAETATSHNITVRATSSDTSFNTRVFTINVTDVDEFDVGVINDSNTSANSVDEDASIGTAAGITSDASDADATNNTITYSLDDDAGGLFAIDANTGVITVNGTLDTETANSHNITVRATSSDTSFNTQVFTINVTNINEAPVAITDNLSINEDTALTINTATDLLGNDTDVEGDTLSITGFTQPGNGSVVDNGDGTFTYTPNANFNGTDSFTVIVSDGNGGTATGTVIITLTPIGDTPQVSNTTTLPDTLSDPIVISPNAIDGIDVTHFQITDINNGTLYHADGTTQINDGDYITLTEAQQGLKFQPESNTASGSFNVRPSKDGVSVDPSSSSATSTITVLASPADTVEESIPDTEEAVEPDELIEETQDITEDINILEESIIDESVNTESQGNGTAVLNSSGRKSAAMASSSSNTNESGAIQNQVTVDFKPIMERLSSTQQSDSNNSLSILSLEHKFNKILDKMPIFRTSYENLKNSLDDFRREADMESENSETVIGSAIAVSTGLSVGYVIWLIRGGMLISSLMSSMPAWQIADPLPILKNINDDEDEDDESLESIIKDNQDNDDKKEQGSEPTGT